MTAADKISDKPGKLILFLGAEWWGSDARALAVALRQESNCLIEVKYEDFFPLNWSSVPLKALRRFIRPLCAANYNQAVMRHLDNAAIDFVLVFKGMLLAPETLEAFRRRNIPLYCFYPDVGFASYGSNIVECLPFYDTVFTTKEFHLIDEKLHARLKSIKLVRHGFDPEVHRPIQIPEAVQKHYACDVSFVGCWSPKKERMIGAVVQNLPGCMVKLWGPGWNRAEESVRRCWIGRGAFGDESAIIYQCSKINLGLLTAAHADTISGDQTTVRTWQIPAAGGFLLHEDTLEFRQHFAAGSEAAVFAGETDLPAQVAHYLASPELRAGIARAGLKRCVECQYTYHSAAKIICDYHDARKSN